MVAAKRSGDSIASEAFPPPEQTLVSHGPAAISYLADELAVGRPWPDVLLEAVGMWRTTREIVEGRELVYLLGGEAFDWLALAARLLREVPGAVPAHEQERLLFRGELPASVTESQFRESLGVAKYRAHLNFFYGVVVEEALWLAAEKEVHKERGVRGLQHAAGIHDLVSQRLYGADQAALVRKFRRSRNQKVSVKFTLAEWKEFTYWLFKLRLARCDAARVASDTRKGLRMLQQLRQETGQQVSSAASPLPLLA